MEWLNDLLWKDTVAHTVLIYSVIIATGVFLGKRKIFGVSLGITFVLFAGIALGHFGFTASHQVLEFLRDFGLILFVFSIGLQVGPGFFSSFRKGGLSLNIMALLIVTLGGAITISIHYLTGTSMPMLAGIMSGAVTNTPGLGAAQTALSQMMEITPGTEIPEISLGYAVAYPFGVLGIILSMIFIKRIFHIDLTKETAAFEEEQHPSEEMPEKVSILVRNPQVFGKSILEISKSLKPGIVISRVLHGGDLHPATSETVIHENDILLVVAQKSLMGEVVNRFGTVSSMDLSSGPGELISRRIIVTNSDVFGKTLGSLKLRTLYNINITRVYRSGIEFIASPALRLQMGDRLTVVGDKKSVNKVAGQLGNSLKRLKEPNIIPLFTGILLGVILGSIPINIPGVAHPLRLGLAGGPLIIAILISKYGYRLSLISYTTTSANLMLREVGISLFLASVGLASGERFMPALTSGEGFVWMGYGALITLLPLLIIGIMTRIILKKNFLEVCGLLSGSMTDPPALAFANNIAQSEAPSIAYA
ncbi:MAG: putative transporter, partial [Bacteroidales bacterium]|nr:putative transporter [Bacteroidales bacterium]